MSVHEPDGMSEMIDELLRVGVMLAARIAERHVREREQQRRAAEAQSAHAAAAAREELARQRQAALASLEGVHSDVWRRHADAGEIRHAWLTAREWAGEEPRANRAVWTIAEQLHGRYALDVHSIDPAAFGQRPELPVQATLSDRELHHVDRMLAERLEELQAERGTASPEQQAEIDQRSGEVQDLREAIAEELALSETNERLARPASESSSASAERERSREQRQAQAIVATVGADEVLSAGYDTRERRQRLAERLSAAGVDAGTVEASVAADVAQAHTPERAPQATSQPVARPDRSRSRGAAQARRPRRLS